MDKYRMTDTARAILQIEVREHIDDDADLSFLQQEPDDADHERYMRERLEAYNRGDWHMVGIDARAFVVVDHVRQEITSGGLWGIESDSDADYLREIAGEELSSLVSILRALGFDDDDIAAATPAL
jgi:hypothetical protein